MSEIIKVEYDDNCFIDVEIKEDGISSGGGLGGEDRVKVIGKKIYDGCIDTIISMINKTSTKIKDNIDKSQIENISLTVGCSITAEGNMVLAKTSTEAALSITITLK